MSPIKTENLELLNSLEKTLRDQLLWLGRETVNQISATVERSRNLKQFVIGLSVAIVGVIFPLFLGKDLIVIDFFIVALGLFVLVVVLGLVGLIIPTLKEVVEMPRISSHHAEQVLKLIKRIQEIKKLDDNLVAGKEYLNLKNEYISLDLGQLNKLSKLYYRYEDIIIYSLFLNGFTFLVIGIFYNFSIGN